MLARMAFWFSGQRRIRTRMPKTTSTRPYARFRCSCIQTSSQRTPTATGRMIVRNPGQP